jgi:hypothetical protein
MSCLPCGRGFHDECEDPKSEIHCCCDIEDEDKEEEPTKKQRVRRDNVTISAGRKRAAADFEINKEAPCDWRGRANCGGGFIPIVGCIIGFQTARHHGPDKNTTNNSEDNVHLICTPCHNLWHRRNDPKYSNNKCPEGIKLHDPRWATTEELMNREPVA